MNVNADLVAAAFITLDFLTGMVKAFATRTYSSTKMREGLFHKVSLVLCVILGILVDYAQGYVELGVTLPVHGAICGYVCVMELGSIVENLCVINPDLMPERLASFFHHGGEQNENGK